MAGVWHPQPPRANQGPDPVAVVQPTRARIISITGPRQRQPTNSATFNCRCSPDTNRSSSPTLNDHGHHRVAQPAQHVSTMLAPHRDVENQVHGHHPKTPGTRYPKTPLRRDRNDENAPTAFAGKNTIGGASRLAGVDKSMTKGNTTRQPLVTPMSMCEQVVKGLAMLLTGSPVIRRPLSSCSRQQDDQRESTNRTGSRGEGSGKGDRKDTG